MLNIPAFDLLSRNIRHAWGEKAQQRGRTLPIFSTAEERCASQLTGKARGSWLDGTNNIQHPPLPMLQPSCHLWRSCPSTRHNSSLTKGLLILLCNYLPHWYCWKWCRKGWLCESYCAVPKSSRWRPTRYCCYACWRTGENLFKYLESYNSQLVL